MKLAMAFMACVLFSAPLFADRDCSFPGDDDHSPCSVSCGILEDAICGQNGCYCERRWGEEDLRDIASRIPALSSLSNNDQLNVLASADASAK